MKFLSSPNVESFIRTDGIRLFKLLEMSQYAVITFFITLLSGTYLDYVIPKMDKENGVVYITLETMLYFVIVIVGSYYIKKFVTMFPFFLAPLNLKYTPNKKFESGVGIKIGFAYMFSKTQVKIGERVQYIANVLGGAERKGLTKTDKIIEKTLASSQMRG